MSHGGSPQEGMEGLENVTDYGEMLKSRLPEDIHVEILHGKMKPADKRELWTPLPQGIFMCWCPPLS